MWWWFRFLQATVLMNAAQKIPIVLSSTDMNRLSIKNGRIKHVFGADLFQIEKDEETGQIFLSVKESAILPDAMSMAFVTDNGATQDLHVSFEDGIAKPVIFKAPEQKPSARQTAKQFFHDVLTNNTATYVRQDSGQNH